MFYHIKNCSRHHALFFTLSQKYLDVWLGILYTFLYTLVAKKGKMGKYENSVYQCKSQQNR